MSMPDFSFRKDFKHIKWKETLLLNLIRSFSAGIIWLIAGITIQIADQQTQQAMPLAAMLLFPIMLPVAYFTFLMPVGLICSFLSDIGIPFVGLITAFAAISVAVGDPIMYVLHSSKPGLVPVEDYGFFNFRMIIFVLDIQHTTLGVL